MMIMSKLHDWIESNWEQLYEQTKESEQTGPGRMNLRRGTVSMKLDKTTGKYSMYRSDIDVKEAQKKIEFKKMLYTFAEEKVLDHKRRLRKKKIDQINYKLFSDSKYREKNTFFEFQIETQMQ